MAIFNEIFLIRVYTVDYAKDNLICIKFLIQIDVVKCN